MLPSTQERVLIVEDDVNLLEGLKEILEMHNQYQVMTAENGKQGLEILRNNVNQPPDLIVSDIMMPGMDGFKFFEAVREESRWMKIPFIFLTAKDTKKDIQYGKLLGVDDYLVKPFDPEELLTAVQQRLRRQRMLNVAMDSDISTLKRNILTIIHHEFRTPLTFVVAYADMLNDNNVAEFDDEELLTFLRGVHEGARRIRRLIENFITLIELETGEAANNFEWRKRPMVQLPAIVEQLCYQVREEYQERKVEFTFTFPDNLPTIVVDHEYIRSAIVQLIENAIKFTDKDKVAKVAVKLSTQDDMLYLSIRDNGRGIPEEEFESIWKNFYQINRPVYEDQGTGTGLSIVRKIVDLHNGTVMVESEEGAGSTFTLALPLQQGLPNEGQNN